MESSSALGGEPDPWEYWDPISDSYRSKKSGKNITRNEEQRRISKSSPDSSLERNEDPAAGCWEYWDPISDSYKSKKPSRNTPDKGEEGGISKPSLDSSHGRNEDPAVGCWEYYKQEMVMNNLSSKRN